MKIISIIVLSIIAGVMFSYVLEYLHNRIIYNKLKYINRYQKRFRQDDIMIRYKGKVFYIVVDYLVDDPIYKCKLYINEELCLTGIELNHGNTNSRQLEYNHNRSWVEIDKLLKLAYKKYYEHYMNVDYSFKSFWED